MSNANPESHPFAVPMQIKAFILHLIVWLCFYSLDFNIKACSD